MAEMIKQAFWLRWYPGSTVPQVDWYPPSNAVADPDRLLLGPYIVEFPMPDEAQREIDVRATTGAVLDEQPISGNTRKPASGEVRAR